MGNSRTDIRIIRFNDNLLDNKLKINIMDTSTLANALKSVFGNNTIDNPSSSSKIPYCDSNGLPAGLASISNLASVLGVGSKIVVVVSGGTLDTTKYPSSYGTHFYLEATYRVHFFADAISQDMYGSITNNATITPEKSQWKLLTNVS